MFAVTYPNYDASHTPELIFIKGMVDDYARRGVEEEEARRYLLDKDSDFEEEDEDNEPEGRGLTSTS